ncbi:MAG: response regulator [Gammaproteobacteria bacterium]|nr:response regulator [Gammaproteobacteria bacterium]
MPNTGELTILIVDDNENNLFALRTLINEHINARVLEADSGDRALRLLLQEEVALIILDIQMPNMDGFEIARIIRSSKKTQHVPIVFLTAAYKAEEFQKKGYALGAGDYLTKPIDPPQLISRLKVYLRFIEQERAHNRELEHKVRKRTAELQKAHDELEARVEERTAELLQTNSLLQTEITEHKQAQEELCCLRNLFSNIINSMPSILIAVDVNGLVTQWNREAERMTGVPATEAQGLMLAVVFPQLAREMEKVKQAIRSQEPQKETKVPCGHSDKMRFADITVYPLVNHGVEGAVIRVDDVTERVRIEEVMIQSEKMLSVGGLAAGMAHEINNLLAGILQNIQVMHNRISGDLPKNREVAEACGVSMETIESYMTQRGLLSMIESVKESGKRAGKIVNDMLNFSRKSASGFLPHDLGKLLDTTVELASKDYDLKKKHDFRQIEIVREYAAAMSNVPCEASEIQQVFLNLLKNGAQAMIDRQDKNGLPPRFILRVMPDRGMARVEIEDNGPGMDEITRKRVFEPFFTTKSVGVGTGLGLSVSYFIITENHGGTIEVESVHGKGAKFIIKLPLVNG